MFGRKAMAQRGWPTLLAVTSDYNIIDCSAPRPRVKVCGDTVRFHSTMMRSAHST